MKPRLQEILDAMHRYNTSDMAGEVFGLDRTLTYDALVVAPSYTPPRLLPEGFAQVTPLRERINTAAWLVEKDGLKIAWILPGTSAANCLDHMALCAELKLKHLIFLGAVGALTPEFRVGDLCTPAYSIPGTFANAYLAENLRDFAPFRPVEPDGIMSDRAAILAAQAGYELKRAPVFCTDSIAAEYAHLDEIKAMGAELIEMETATFYQTARLMEIPAVALLVVSDNSAAGVSLVGRDEETFEQYHRARSQALPDLIFKIAALK